MGALLPAVSSLHTHQLVEIPVVDLLQLSSSFKSIQDPPISSRSSGEDILYVTKALPSPVIQQNITFMQQHSH